MKGKVIKMACEYDRQRELEAAKAAALEALLTGAATLQKNILTGKIEIQGLNPASKNGCADACIIAGLAVQAASNPSINRFFTTAGIKPGETITAHQASHQQHTH